MSHIFGRYAASINYGNNLHEGVNAYFWFTLRILKYLYYYAEKRDV
jgi:hypothetical protein